MRSKASFKGHPIHPALIPFPLAFLIGALVFDAVGVFGENPALWRTGGHLALAGVATALLAAVPGLIDYIYTVPPNSSGKARATRHMIVNLSAVALFVIAIALRGGPPGQPSTLTMLIQFAAVGLLTAGGWMGGVLVSRNQIGVDHRYARAGKWLEASIAARTGEWIVAAKADELEVNQMKLLRLGDRRVVLARGESGWFAFDDGCTHRGGSLAGGVMICDTVHCPWHGSQFDVRSGAVTAGPAKSGIGTYPVQEKDGMIRLTIESSRPAAKR